MMLTDFMQRVHAIEIATRWFYTGIDPATQERLAATKS